MIYPQSSQAQTAPRGMPTTLFVRVGYHRCMDFSNPADASGTALQRLWVNSFFILLKCGRFQVQAPVLRKAEHQIHVLDRLSGSTLHQIVYA